jgi:hypothetical protein
MAAAASSKPPNLHVCHQCAECAHYDGRGMCLLYNYAVQDDEVCDSFKALPKDEASKRLWAAHRRRISA